MVYVYLNEKELEKTKKKAKERAQVELHGDENKDNILFYPDARLDLDDIRLEDGEIKISLSFWDGKEDLGYISLDIPLSSDIAIEVINFYMKKLGRLKTILEATQNE